MDRRWLSNFGLNFGQSPKFWPKTEYACCHLKNLCESNQIIGLRPKFGLRTKSDLFFQVTHCVRIYSSESSLKTVAESLKLIKFSLEVDRPFRYYLLLWLSTWCSVSVWIVLWKLGHDSRRCIQQLVYVSWLVVLKRSKLWNWQSLVLSWLESFVIITVIFNFVHI